MLTLLRLYTVAAISLFLTACSMVTVTTDYDHSAPFGRYQTYTLTSSRQDLPLSPSGEAALHDTLQAKLATRGLREVSEGADVHVVRHVFTQEKIDIYPASSWGYAGYPYRYGRYGPWGGAPAAYTDVSQYTEGTLILDFVDAKTQKLVFRGIAKGTVGDPGTNANRIREAVTRIVDEFPGGSAP
jgi:hypothetical protein